MLKEKLLEHAQELQPSLVDYRRYLHQNPETHTNLPLTSAFVKEKLREMGYDPMDCGDSGVVALAGGKKPGKVFLIRGDMDALPVTEEADVAFRSTNGNMHACGHDLHTAMLLGAAKLLKEHEDEIEGTVKLMFQPAEETLAGAKMMIDHGLLDNPKVDAAMMIHVAPLLPVPSGIVMIPEAGAGSSASDWFEIHIKGKGGHGASPESAIDPINVACHIHLAIQEINSRELDPSSPAVFTVCKVVAGTTSNVIPDTAQMYGTIRTFTKENREFVPKRMKEISEYTAKAFRAEAEFKLIEGCPSLVNDKSLVSSAKVFLRDLLGMQGVIAADEVMPGRKMFGSEDFGYISERVPSLMLGLAAGCPTEGYTYPAHHPKVVFNEEILYKGASTYAYVAMRWLTQQNEEA